MLEISFGKKPEKNSPYIIDLRANLSVSEKLEKETEKTIKEMVSCLCQCKMKRFKKVKTAFLNLFSLIKKIKYPKVVITIKNSKHYCKEKLLWVGSHILIILIIGGILSVPVFTAWSYKRFSKTKGRVLGAATSAVSELYQAKKSWQNFNWTVSRGHFLNSYQSLNKIESELAEINFLIDKLAPILPKGSSYYYLFKAATYLSRAGYLLSDQELIKEQELIERLKILQQKFLQAKPDLEKVNQYLDKVEITDLPKEYQAETSQLKEISSELSKKLDQAEIGLEHLLLFLGGKSTKRYLVLFQNTLEIRPTGGFIGSLAVLDIKDAKIINLEVPKGGSYDFNYGLGSILAPRPFWVLGNRWQVQDCNWFADFSFSAKQCARFVEQSIGASFNGVIAINLPLIVDLLRLLGSIPMNDYNVVIDENNFIPFTQNLVESDQARGSGAPKQFLADLAPILISRLKAGLNNPELSIDLAEILLNALLHKDILLYSNEKKIQNWFEQNNWSGRIKPSLEKDYLHLNVANVNGGKSDFNIEQKIFYSVKQDQKADKLKAKVEIIRKHLGQSFSDNKVIDNFQNLINQPNLAYIRLYTALGSEFIRASGDIAKVDHLLKNSNLELYQQDDFLQSVVSNPLIAEISNTRLTQEFDKNVFGNYLFVKPGETKKIVFEYYLPAYLDSSNYKIFVQKQAGIFSYYKITLNNKVLFNGKLNQDMLIAN